MQIKSSLLGLAFVAFATSLMGSAASAATADSILANKRAVKAPKRVYNFAKPRAELRPGATSRNFICLAHPCVGNRWKPRPSR